MTESRGAGKEDRVNTKQRRHLGEVGEGHLESHSTLTCTEERTHLLSFLILGLDGMEKAHQGWAKMRWGSEEFGKEQPVLRAPPDPTERHSTLRKGLFPQACGRGPRCVHWIKGRHSTEERESSSPQPCDGGPMCVHWCVLVGLIWAWCLWPVTSASRRLRQEDHAYKVSLG